MEKGARIDPIALNNMERLSEPNWTGSPKTRFSNFFSQDSLMFLGPEMDSNWPARRRMVKAIAVGSRTEYSRL
jgi:hypothetical protein